MNRTLSHSIHQAQHSSPYTPSQDAFFTFFFFKSPGPPRHLPFSPPRLSPDLVGAPASALRHTEPRLGRLRRPDRRTTGLHHAVGHPLQVARIRLRHHSDPVVPKAYPGYLQ